jgi:hypothetical protein
LWVDENPQTVTLAIANGEKKVTFNGNKYIT